MEGHREAHGITTTSDSRRRKDMNDMSVCSLLVPCRHCDPDRPCQFVDGKCPRQEEIVRVADKIKAAWDSPHDSTADEETAQTGGKRRGGG